VLGASKEQQKGGFQNQGTKNAYIISITQN
jgi:hypothetical protein